MVWSGASGVWYGTIHGINDSIYDAIFDGMAS